MYYMGQWETILPVVGNVVTGALGIGKSVIESKTLQQQAKALAQQAAADARQQAIDAAERRRAEQVSAQQLYAQQAYGASSSARTQQVIALVLVGGAALAIGWYLLKQSKKGA